MWATKAWLLGLQEKVDRDARAAEYDAGHANWSITKPSINADEREEFINGGKAKAAPSPIKGVKYDSKHRPYTQDAQGNWVPQKG